MAAVLITGTSSGIGLATAVTDVGSAHRNQRSGTHELKNSRAHLAIVAREPTNLLVRGKQDFRLLTAIHVADHCYSGSCQDGCAAEWTFSIWLSS
jgi:hypothetical protein